MAVLGLDWIGLVVMMMIRSEAATLLQSSIYNNIINRFSFISINTLNHPTVNTLNHPTFNTLNHPTVNTLNHPTVNPIKRKDKGI